MYEPWGKKPSQIQQIPSSPLSHRLQPCQAAEEQQGITPQFQHFKIQAPFAVAYGQPYITAEKCSSSKETPASQRDTRASLSHKPHSSWLPPQPVGNKTRPILAHLASPRHIRLGRASPASTCVHWSSPSSTRCHLQAHLCWQLGHSTDLLLFGISPALSQPPGAGWPHRDPSLTTVLPDASTPTYPPPHTSTGKGRRVSSSSSWRHRCSRHNSPSLFSSLSQTELQKLEIVPA